MAVLALDDRLVGDLHGVAAGRLRQVDFGGGGDIAAVDRPAGAAAERAGAAERAAEPAAAEERVEDVGK